MFWGTFIYVSKLFSGICRIMDFSKSKKKSSSMLILRVTSSHFFIPLHFKYFLQICVTVSVCWIEFVGPVLCRQHLWTYLVKAGWKGAMPGSPGFWGIPSRNRWEVPNKNISAWWASVLWEGGGLLRANSVCCVSGGTGAELACGRYKTR